MIGGFQNRSDWNQWNDISCSGFSQNQFNNHDRIPHSGWDFHYAGGTYSSHQTSAPTVPAVAPLHQPRPYCKICDVKLGSYKNVESHLNGKKHRRMLGLHEELQREKTLNRQILNSQMNSVVQPETVCRFGENGCLVKDMSSEAPIVRHYNFLQKDIGVTYDVPGEGPEGKPRDKFGSRSHSLKPKIVRDKTSKYIKTSDEVRRPVESSKIDIGDEVRRPVESSKIDIDAPSPILIPELAPLSGHGASHVMEPIPAVRSSFNFKYKHVTTSQSQVSEGKEYHEIQNPIADKNNQPHSSSDSNIMASQVFVPQPSAAHCKICDVKLSSYKNIEMHNSGKTHQYMLKLRKEYRRRKTSKRQISNSQVNLVGQPKAVMKSRKNRWPVKYVSSKGSISKHRNYRLKDMDNISARGHGFKYNIEGGKTGKYMKTNDGVRRPMESSKLDANTALAPLSGPIPSQIMAPASVVGSNLKLQFQDVSASQTQISKGREHHEIQNPTADTNNQPHATVDPNINTQTEHVSSDSASIVMESPKGLMESQVFTPSSAVGSSFELQIQPVLQTHVLEGKEHHEIQSPVETNDQPQSILVELQLQDVSASRTQISKGREHSEIQNPTAATSNQPHATVNANINTQTEHVSTDSAAIVMESPKRPMESQVFTPSPSVGSSFEPQIQPVLQTHVLEGKEHCEIQIQSPVETIDQPQSILVEVPAHAGSDINAQTDYLSFDSAGIAVEQPKELMESCIFSLSPAVGSSFEPPIQHVSQTEVLGSKVHEIQNPPVETNYQSNDHIKSNSVSNTQTADGSFEPQIQHVSQTEVLERKVHEIQNPPVETNYQSNDHIKSNSVSNTQMADGSSSPEQDMDLLINKSETTQLSKVSVCLKCGNEGFSELLVFCDRCQVYALHRYCVDGPVIFDDGVTWFCEDCEPKVVETSSYDQCTLLSGSSDSVNSAKDASQTRIEPNICLEREEKNKQKEETIAAKSTVLLSNNQSFSQHGLSSCSNSSKKEKKFEFQPLPGEEANIGEDSVTVAVPLPISEPAWRGSLCLRYHSFGTVIGLLAHQSSLACSKVSEEARLFPEMLSTDLLQRSAVWPETFRKGGTNQNSIALYFFPESESVERDYDKLVDQMISLDLAIRAVVENAELLVFTSTLLPIQYRRFQEKYYLWGVFRSKKTLITNEAVRV